METALAVKRMHKAAKAIRGTSGEFRRNSILNFCRVAIAMLQAGDPCQ